MFWCNAVKSTDRDESNIDLTLHNHSSHQMFNSETEKRKVAQVATTTLHSLSSDDSSSINNNDAADTKNEGGKMALIQAKESGHISDNDLVADYDKAKSASNNDIKRK